MTVEALICSFDVFDTVLTRVFARPTDLFAALFYGDTSVGEGGCLPKMDAIDFVKARAEAERRARRLTATEEITIVAIYEQLGDALELAPQQRHALMQAEIDLEMRSVRPVPAILAQIQQARAEGKRVIFVSDMYLPATAIRSMLEQCGAYRAGDGLYVSSEAGATKGTGNLYRHLLDQEGAQPGRLLHTGDHAHADVECARELGIRATHFGAAHLNRYEAIVADAPQAPPMTRSLVAGASRLARLACPYGDDHRRTIWATGASVAGPILTGYVAWLLHDARSRGLNRVYFVSRDGQILLRIARRICQKLAVPLDCRYLYGSRQAWHLPAIESLGAFEYDWILAPTDFLSAAAVLGRVSLSPLEAEAELEEIGLGPEAWQRNLDATERHRLGACLRSGQLKGKILSKAGEKRQDAIRYLHQEGLFDAVPYAVVDIGWNGRLQRSLGTIIALGGHDRRLVGYYFGLRARVDPRPHDELNAYLWDGAESLPYGTVGFQTRTLMEIFAAADHGGVVGYQDSGEPRPVLAAEKNRAAMEWGVAIQQEGIVGFVDALDATALEGLASPEWRGPWAGLLRQFFLHPAPAEARAYGRFPVAEDQNEVLQQSLARPFTVRDAFRALVRGTAAHHHNEWRAASKLLTPLPVYGAVRLAEKVAHAIEDGRRREVHGREPGDGP